MKDELPPPFRYGPVWLMHGMSQGSHGRLEHSDRVCLSGSETVAPLRRIDLLTRMVESDAFPRYDRVEQGHALSGSGARRRRDG